MDSDEFSEDDIVYLIPLFKTKRKTRYVFKLKREGVFYCKFGSIQHKEIIGKIPGTVIKSDQNYSFVVLRAELPEMIWYYKEFKYATQVIYPRDWGIIMAFGDINPDHKIVEIGTGSGGILAFLANRLKNGKIYSYEKDPERAKIAEKNLESMNVPKKYEIKVRDVAKEGVDEKDVDVIIIDIPEPWEVIEEAWCALRPGGKIIVYTPTYNQLERVLLELMRHGFIDIKIKETIVRDIQTKLYAIRPMLKGYYFSAFIIFAKKSLVIPRDYITQFILKKKITSYSG